MYDNNPFREAKKIYEEEKSDFMKKLQFVMDPVHAQYGDEGAQNRESMRAAILKKKNDHKEMVRRGELTQAEYDRLERMGEFDIKEAKKFESFEHCVEFYMDVKDMSKEDARRACEHRPDDIQEEDDYQRLAQMDPREPFGSEEDYEAKQADHERKASAIDHVKRFITSSNSPHAAKIMKQLKSSEVLEHDEDTSVVRVGETSFKVEHGTGKVSVVS